MPKKKTLILLILGIILLVVLIIGRKVSRAQDVSSVSGASSKLEELIQGQKQILEELKSIKEQLNAIQVYTNKL